MDLFDQLTRGYIGSDRFFNLQAQLAANAKKFGTFPFYNIKKTDENKYTVELALAGYSISDLEITLEKNILTISSSGKDENSTDYIFKGFASRKFTRQFTLMDNIKVTGADLVNGILSVWLEEYVKEEDKPKKINIGAPSEKQHPQLLNEASNF
jgi:molecular chaperone IbpA